MIVLFFYLLFFSLITFGYGQLLSKVLAEKNQNPAIIFLYGFSFQTLFASAWVVFFPLGNAIKIILWIGGLILFIFFIRKEKEFFHHFTQHLATKIVYLAFAFAYAITKLASPSEIMDEGLQYINVYHMLEQVGTSKGIGNLLPHVTLNSNWHLLNALFNTQGIFNTFPLYEANGFLVLLLFLLSYQGALEIAKDSYSIVPIVKLLSPLFLFRNQLTGGGTDVVVYAIGVILLTHFLDCVRKKKELGCVQLFPLIIIPVFLVTVKFIALPFLILSVGAMLFCFLKVKPIVLVYPLLFCFALMGFWLCRNVMMSGYLLSGVAFVRFDVAWAMSSSAIDALSNKIQFGVFGQHNFSSFLFLKNWLGSFPFFQRLLVGCSFIVTLVYLFLLIYKAVQKKMQFLEFFFFATLISGFFIWMFTVSEFRYGAIYHFFNAMIFFGYLSTFIPKIKFTTVVFFGFFSLGIFYQIYRNLKEYPMIGNHILIPAKNPTVKFSTVNKRGWQYYIPSEYVEPLTNRDVFYFNMNKETYDLLGCWNVPFPCVCEKPR